MDQQEPISPTSKSSDDNHVQPMDHMLTPAGGESVSIAQNRSKKVIIWKDRNQSVQLLNVNESEQGSLSMDYLDDRDPNLVYAKFLHAYHCYDLIPTSSKLVVFDTQLNVKKAFFALIYNGVRAAPLWDTEQQKFVGMLTITDFIKILQRYYKEHGADMAELEEHKINTWREVLQEYSTPLVYIEPEASLFEAIQLLWQNRVHRLPVIDTTIGNALFILTHKRVLRFLYLYIYELPEPAFMRKSLAELRLGTYTNVISAHRSTPVIDAINSFVENRISALPILDNDENVVDIYAKFDVIHLAADKSYNNLNMTIEEALQKRRKEVQTVATCYKTDTLKAVMEQIVQAEFHRLAVVSADMKLEGIISLSDILHFLILKPTGDGMVAVPQKWYQ